MKRQKKCISIYHNMWLGLSMVVLAMVLITILSVPYILEGHHEFSDFAVGELAYSGGNKTGEWRLFWGTLLFGCIGAVVSACLHKGEDKPIGCRSALLCFLPCMTHLLLYGKTTGKMIFLSAFVACVVLIYKHRAKSLLALFVTIYFFVESFAVLAAVCFSNYFLKDSVILVVAALAFAILIWVEKAKDKNAVGEWMQSILKGLQLPLPLLLLVYLKNDYDYLGTVLKIGFPLRYIGIILCMIVLLIGLNVYFLKKSKSAIFVTTVFSVFAFVSYVSPAMIMPLDLHHHGEQILAWQQIVELGQTAYDGYAPASGMFPMMIGAINSLIFGGAVNTYGISYICFMLFFEALTMYLLWKRLGGEWTLFISVLFHMPVYCRTWIILPALLILTDKKTMANPLRWLLHWVFVCFLCGLYYPLYAGAVLVGTLPYGIGQIVRMFREKLWKKYLKTGEICYGIFVTAMVLVSMPLLYRMLMHILSMGGQTLDVDGDTVMNYATPEWFMPYLNEFAWRNSLYYLTRFVLSAIFVVVAVYIVTLYGQKISRKKDKKHLLECLYDPGFAAVLPIPVVLCVAYTYTMVCMDEDWVANILSRSAHVILLVCGIYGIVVLKEYGKEILHGRDLGRMIALTFSIPFLFFYNCEDYHFPYMEGTTDADAYVVGEYQSKLYPYTVKEDYVLVTSALKEQYASIDFARVGEGFVRSETMDKLELHRKTLDYLKLYDPDVRILGFEMSQMYYYMLNEKTVYSGRTGIAKSAKATQAVIEQMDEHTVVRSRIVQPDQYYLYRHIVQSGYVYSPDLDLYMPGQMYKTIYGTDGSLNGSPWTADIDCGMLASCFGNSMKTMDVCEALESVDYTCQSEQSEEGTCIRISLKEAVSGEEADFLKLQLKNAEEGTLFVRWQQEDGTYSSTISCHCKNGILLIPMGIHANWMKEEHADLELMIEDVAQPNEVIIEEFAFYHLK